MDIHHQIWRLTPVITVLLSVVMTFSLMTGVGPQATGWNQTLAWVPALSGLLLALTCLRGAPAARAISVLASGVIVLGELMAWRSQDALGWIWLLETMGLLVVFACSSFCLLLIQSLRRR